MEVNKMEYVSRENVSHNYMSIYKYKKLKVKYENTKRELLSRTEKLRELEIKHQELYKLYLKSLDDYQKLSANYDIVVNK